MKSSYIIAGVLLASVAVGSAKIGKFALPAKKGAILEAWIEPASPTSATAVTLHVSIADYLQLDHVQVWKTATVFTVRMYRDDPADAGGSTPVHHEEPLGTLAPGAYSVNVQSFYRGRLADAERVSFRVSQAPVPPWDQSIDNVWIEPENPTTADTVTLHVSGSWPTSGFSLNRTVVLSSRKSSGMGTVTLQMHWSSPRGPVLTVVTPYQHQADLRKLRAGTYAVRVESNLDRRLVDWADISFEVKPAN